MLVACRLAGLSALERYYAGVGQAGKRRALRFRSVPNPRPGLYDVRPHACASIFHSSPRFENV